MNSQYTLTVGASGDTFIIPMKGIIAAVMVHQLFKHTNMDIDMIAKIAGISDPSTLETFYKLAVRAGIIDDYEEELNE